MFNPMFNAVGIATGPHKSYRSMTTMDFALIKSSKNTPKMPTPQDISKEQAGLDRFD